MRLLKTHPKVATRDCGHCLDFVYNENTGKPRVDREGNLFPRPRGTNPPCRICPKGPTPFSTKALNPSNERAYFHYLECKAVGIFPDDSTVRRTALLIGMIEEQSNRAELIETLMTVRGTNG